MKKTLLSFVLALLVLPIGSFMPLAAQATSFSTNTAIRGTSTDTVYWYATDGKRYVFPNALAFYSWFPSFDNVRTIADSELYAIAIGGNVTYRPGAKLVKVTTDPRTYAVSRGGVLRHVTSEALASQLYGYDWRSKVNDVPDVYFTNYTVGSPLYNVSDYNVSNEYNGVSTPSDSLRGVTSGSTYSTNDLVLSVSRTSINPGEAVVVSVGNMPAYTAGDRVELYDARDNGLLCNAYWPNMICNSFTFYPQRKSTENSVQYYVVFTDSTSLISQRGYSQVISFNGSNYSTGTFSSGSSSLSADRSSVNNGDTVTLTATASNLNTSASYIRMELYRESNNLLLDTCYDSATCTFSPRATNDGSGAIRFYVIVKNDANEQIPAAYSPRITVSGGSNQIGTLRMNTDRTNITSGQAVYLTSDYSGNLPSGGRIEIKQVGNSDPIVKTCYNASSCNATVYPLSIAFSVTQYSTQYSATVYDASSNQIVTQNGPRIWFNNTNQSNTFTFSSGRSNVTSGDTITLTAHASDIRNWNNRNITIINQSTGVLVGTCYSTFICTKTATVTGTDGQSVRFSADYIDAGNGMVIDGGQVTVYVSSNGTNNGSTTSNDGVNYINGLVLNADRTSISPGNVVRLTANAFNTGSWSYSGNRIDILNVQTGSVVKSCYDVSTCAVDVYPQATASTNLTAQYQVKIYDRNGSLIMSQYSPVIYLSSYNGSSYDSSYGSSLNGSAYITFAPTENLRVNRTIFLVASFTGMTNLAAADAQIQIFTELSSTPVATCIASYTCSVSFPTGTSPINTRTYARISERNNSSRWLETNHTSLVTTW